MSETLFKFFLSEVKKLRLVCQREECKSTTEVPLEKLKSGDATFKCPVCHREYFDLTSSSQSPIARLALAIQDLEIRTGNVKVEISLPVSESK